MIRLVLCILFASLIAPSFANADLVEFTDEFPNANGAPGSTTPADWDVLTGSTTFVLESGDPDDGAILDTGDDGYATLNGNVTGNGGNFNPMVSRNLGVVAAADVGSVINVDISFLEVSVGANVIGGVASNGSYVSQVSGSTFGANPNNGLLNITYTVDAADVGSTLAAKFQFFSSSDARSIGLDSVVVDISPAAVPEPTTLTILGGFACSLCLFRRRRQLNL